MEISSGLARDDDDESNPHRCVSVFKPTSNPIHGGLLSSGENSKHMSSAIQKSFHFELMHAVESRMPCSHIIT